MTEKQIENQILCWLLSKRIFAWKNQSVGVFDPVKKVYRKSFNRFHINGVSDILGVLPDGRFLAIEVKAPKGKLSDAQADFLQRVIESGGVAFVARSVDEVEAHLMAPKEGAA